LTVFQKRKLIKTLKICFVISYPCALVEGVLKKFAKFSFLIDFARFFLNFYISSLAEIQCTFKKVITSIPKLLKVSLSPVVPNLF
jgi:hypothetical protein